ncbi:MAG TPA: hypothetical protein VF748_16145, partial [Candidatus Acidoferrum sp.]
ATLYRASMLPSNDLGNATAEIQWPNARANPLTLPLPSNNSLANRSFRIRLFGRCSAGLLTTITINVYFGLSPTISSNTQIFGTGPQLFNGNSNFNFWLDMTWDSTSQSISGIGQGQVANNVIGVAALWNTPVSADPNRDSNSFLQSGPTYGFSLTGFFGNASAGNHAFVDDFSMELL